MGQKQTSSSRAEVDVGDPLHVQHTAQLKLDSRKGIVLQVPELDAYLRKEGVPFSDRTTWDVLRYVYHAGGLELVKNTLQLIRERRASEPAPDYDLTCSTATSRSNSSASSSDRHRRRNCSSQDDDDVVHHTSPSESMRKSGAGVARRSSSHRKAPPLIGAVDSPQMRRLRAPATEAALSEVDEEWRSARSSVYETQEVTIRWAADSPPAELIRPASKVWKRSMAPEVHADLVRALKARESSVDNNLDELQHVEVRRTHTIFITDPDMNG